MGGGAAEGADGGVDVGRMNEDTNDEAVRSGERTVHLELMPTDGCRILTGAVEDGEDAVGGILLISICRTHNSNDEYLTQSLVQLLVLGWAPI
jgi:hypothetical protein